MKNRNFLNISDAFIYFARCNISTIYELTSKSTPQCRLGRQISIAYRMMRTAFDFGYANEELLEDYRLAVSEALIKRPEMQKWLQDRKELPPSAWLENDSTYPVQS